MGSHQPISEITVTFSIETPQQRKAHQASYDQKPPKVPPRTKKRLPFKDSDNSGFSSSSEPESSATSSSPEPSESPEPTDAPEIPSRNAEPVNPPPIPSTKKPAPPRPVLKTRQLLEAEFLRGASNPQREVLVAATKNGRERRPESRQRQPAMLLRPNQDPALVVVARSDNNKEVSENSAPFKLDKSLTRKTPHLLVVPMSKTGGPPHQQSRSIFPNRSTQAPLVSRMVFPRPVSGHHHLSQPSVPPVSYGKWLEKSGAGDPEINTRILRRIFGGHQATTPKAIKANGIPGVGGVGGFKGLVPPGHKQQTGNQSTASNLINSKSKPVVSRSGSLSSQCSTSSDSGNESQPKSVLKKSKRNKGNEKPKKSVTFNAMTTVQVMEE